MITPVNLLVLLLVDKQAEYCATLLFCSSLLEDASTPVIDLGEEQVSISITVKWILV
jgi:hypothetical protein